MLHHAGDCIRARCFLRLRRTLFPGRPREPRTPTPGRDRPGHGGYWIGRTGGIALVRRYGRFLHLNEAHLERARHFFARHGPPTVFIGRFVALLRTWTAVLAGAARMPYGRFMLYNALGAVCWAGVVGALGYVFGRNLPRLEHYMGQASLAGALLVALVEIGRAHV